jgi:prepilin-type processing-associated H-X9-DG protein
MEWGTLYDQIQFDKMYYDYTSAGITNLDISKKFIPAYICPSDPRGRELVQVVKVGAEDSAKTNILGVADSENYTCDGSYPKWRADGVLYNHVLTRIADIGDGTSSTLLIGEVIPHTGIDHLGSFWMSWAVGDTHNGINLPLRIPASPFDAQNAGFASHHPGGCHFALADGSVQFLSESIAQAVLRSLTTRMGISSETKTVDVLDLRY